jgi:hypothetical protein
MELFFNLAWGLLAVASIFLWMRIECRKGAARRHSVIALLTLIVILFPVVSVSDDLGALQNPAETDSIQRRDNIASPAHSIFPALAARCESGLADLSFGFAHWASLRNISIAAPAIPAPTGILNRPPPAA